MNIAVRALTPAQKAWETRRLKADARRIQEERKALAAEPPQASPLEGKRMVCLWVDHPEVGSGYRRFVVIEVGATAVRLFCASKLVAIDVDRREFDRHARAVRHNGQIVAGIIRRNLAVVDKVNQAARAVVLSDGGEHTTKALQVLR